MIVNRGGEGEGGGGGGGVGFLKYQNPITAQINLGFYFVLFVEKGPRRCVTSLSML
jgi:hypothetical protein